MLRFKKTFLVHISLFMFVVLAPLSGCDNGSKAHQAGSVASDFRIDGLSHERFYLNQHRGKVVLLIFWTTWCSQCKKEMADLSTMVKAFPQDELVIGAVCSDPENITELKSIVASWKYPFKVYLDHRARLHKKFRLRGFPSTMIIDMEGKIAMIRNGYSPLIMKQLKATIQGLLDQTRNK